MKALLFSPCYFITQKATYLYSRFAARGLVFSLARQGVFDCEHPLQPPHAFCADAVAGRMSIPGHASLASRRRPWRRSDGDEAPLAFGIITITARYCSQDKVAEQLHESTGVLRFISYKRFITDIPRTHEAAGIGGFVGMELND